MSRIIARCPAKLNLSFDVVGTLPNGYHEIATLYQAIDLEDQLTFEFSQSSETNIEIAPAGDVEDLQYPADDSNLICLAARLFLNSLPSAPALSIKVKLEKSIPVGAGLAGGSSNAAATLLALNYSFGHPFGMEELLVLAGKLGADVPFCLEGGTCIGRGIGDELTAVSPGAKLAFLLVKPGGLSISTPWAYQEFDQFDGEKESPDLDSAVSAIKSGDLETAARSFGNAFEPLVFEHHPFLAKLKEMLLEAGAWCCHLTGKGPTLYALVSNLEMAHALRRKFLDKIAADSGDSGVNGVKCFIVESVSYGARLTGES